ncbi:unnamed protein product [Mytilus edulis]|uniref:PHD-type domain-containing protein n=1 Tax=Mytilus edulis TaxID=6550 RepID=A0A8S3RHR8_MYTED|nr:unnamed protein product [Mytilus edulis]
MSLNRLTKFQAKYRLPYGNVKTHTPVVLTDSKGRWLQGKETHQSEREIIWWSKSSEKVQKRVQYLENIIAGKVKTLGNIWLYVWLGTCDLTSKQGKYISLTSQTGDETIDHIIEYFNQIINIIKNILAVNEEASLNNIGCEGCDELYHYNCVGLTRADINKLDPNSPFICVSCNENDLYDPNSDNTIHPIAASTEESSTPIILCPDQNDQVLQNQLSQPAPSSQPSITPLQSSDQPTPSVCELKLEKRIREQEKTINLLQKREKLIGGGETQNTFTKDQQPCQCAKPTYFQQSQTPLDYQYLNLQRQIEIQALESRLKAVETQTMQNLSIQTAMTTQLAIQIQQQTINRLQSQTVMPPTPCQRKCFSTATISTWNATTSIPASLPS